MDILLAILSTIGTLGSAVAGIAAWRAAQRANATATGLAQIERDRRHSELIPQFDIYATLEGTSPDLAQLHVRLVGPVGLDVLDQVTITILDEPGTLHWATGYPDGVTAEMAKQFVWGPWQFNTGASTQVSDSRTTKPKAYSRKDDSGSDRLSLRRTSPGHWMKSDPVLWKNQYWILPFRLRIECNKVGYLPWYLLKDVEPRSEPSQIRYGSTGDLPGVKEAR